MLRLSLLRHAKSSWDEPGLDDFARPLAKRGLEAAPHMGAFIAAQELHPDLVLCSSAVRTRATLDLVLPFLETAPALAYEDDLYLATPSQLMSRLKHVPTKWLSVMIVGHNPGLHDLATALASNTETALYKTLTVKFPTAALAVFTFNAASWAKIAPGTGKLVLFATPATVAKAHD